MDFQLIQIDGFGTLTDLQIDDVKAGLNVYYGANGSGKTTLLHFLRGVFCGFEEAWKLNLLPPLKGGSPGGSLSLAEGASRWTVVRRGRLDHHDALAIQVRHGDAEEAQSLRARIERLDRDLVQLLYFVGSYEAHSISGLVHLALRDGIDLTTTRVDASWIEQLVQAVDVRRKALWESPSMPRALGQRLAAVDHTLQMADQADRLQQTRQETVVDELQRIRLHLQRLDGEYAWLTAELQPVDADLTECQTRLWSRRSRTIREVQYVATHEVDGEPEWERELKELDRQIEHAKQVLRDLAAARLRLALESTTNVCAETPDEATTLQIQRELLNRMEERLIDLQAQGETYRQSRMTGQCDCDTTATRWQHWQQQIGDVRQLVYALCQHLGRRESVLGRQSVAQEQASIEQCEGEVLERIRRLRMRREELLAACSNPYASRIRHAVSHELDSCQCARHSEFASRLRQESEVQPTSPREMVSERSIEESDARADDAALEQRLIRRKRELQLQLFDLQRRSRDAHQRIASLNAEQERFADDHSVMLLRFSNRQAEEQLAIAKQQWTSLTMQRELLTQARRRLHRDEQSRVIAEASALLSRLTQGRYTHFKFEPATKELFIQSAEGRLLPPNALSRGTLDQTALSFRLALVAEYARRGLRLPLVLDDVLVDSDEQRLAAAVEILREVAASGQQIVFLTCQEHLSDLFDEHGIKVRTIRGSTRPTSRPSVNRSSTSPRTSVDVVALTPTIDLEPVVSPLPLMQEDAHEFDSAPRIRIQPEGPYWLRVDSSLEHLPSLERQEIACLASLGITDIGELIVFDVESALSDLERVHLSADLLRQWQSEARLLATVPDLTGAEGQLLAMIGVENPVELGSTDESVLIARIETALERSPEKWAARLRALGDWTNQSRVRSWVRNGRRAMSFRAASQWAGWKPKRLQDLERGDWDHWTRDRTERDFTDGSGTDSRRNTRGDFAMEPLQLTTGGDGPEMIAGSTRFYLHSASPVVDAPSIGPKTAERFAAFGLLTVRDFLNRPAAWIAEQLDDSRLNSDVIRTWQLQSSLMCQIPGLRGHDVQILVACDLTTPEQIRNHTPDQLLALVGPFSESREGQRMLRSANPPDLEEVHDWIRWAGEARQLHAA